MFALEESVPAASSAICSSSYFHGGSPKGVRMPALEAHTLSGTLPKTREPLFG